MPSTTITDLRACMDELADQLCLAVDGNFDFAVGADTDDESVQKLQMLVNFVLDAARRGLTALEDQNKKLAELDRMKSEFMANVSHELRTPLTLILAPLESLLTDNRNALAEPARNELERIRRNAYRLHALVGDLLDFARLEAGKMKVDWEAVDAVELVRQIAHDVKAAAQPRRIGVQVHTDSLGPVALDRRMYEKIVLNLASNALKFTPEDGRIDISLRSEGDDFSFAVSDSGPGIPQDQLGRLFRRFEQADSSATRKHEGTGIGLALVKEFTELMGGSVGVESEVDRGSRFFVRLPKGTERLDSLAVCKEGDRGAPGSPSRRMYVLGTGAGAGVSSPAGSRGRAQPLCGPAAQDRSADESSTPRPRLLIADDNADMRGYMCDLLADEFDIVAVENGRLALEAARTHRPDIIVSDVMMPEMDGLELVSRLKSDPELRQIHVILVTARASREAVVGGLECGADDYLSKPFGPAELRARVRAAQRACRMYRELAEKSSALEAEIRQRRKAEEERERLYRQLVEASRQAGMAEVASNVLHNVGNVLNSVNVSATIVADKVRRAPAQDVVRLVDRLGAPDDDLGQIIADTEKGRQLVQFLSELGRRMLAEQDAIARELEALTQSVEHLKGIIEMQQSYAKVAGVEEDVSVQSLIEDAIRINDLALNRHQIRIIREVQDAPTIRVDRHKVLQILVNLIRNAKYAISRTGRTDGEIRVRTQLVETQPDRLWIEVLDNGEGIPAENLTRIFAHGFTTRKDGHGFGLHSSAIAARSMGGSLTAHSDGLGCGTAFRLELPVTSGAKTP